MSQEFPQFALASTYTARVELILTHSPPLRRLLQRSMEGRIRFEFLAGFKETPVRNAPRLSP